MKRLPRLRQRRDPVAAPPAPAPSALERRRRDLAEQVAELQFDLGGLAFEMAIRDHFRLDVLVRRAADLQQVDSELAEVDRLLRMEQSAVSGTCTSCGAPHSRAAVFCWQCGAGLLELAPAANGTAAGLSAPPPVDSGRGLA